jgi:hypothetical protein
MAMNGSLLARLLSMDHPEMPPHLVLMCKLVALAWVLTGQAFYLPHIPLQALPLVTGCAGAALVLFSPWIRIGTMTLGLTIFVCIWSNLAYFSYNRLFCASLLMVCGLAPATPLPRLQVAVLYLGAGWDKLLAPDWRNGVVLHTLVEELAVRGRLWSPGGHVGEPNPVPHWLLWVGDSLAANPFWMTVSALVIGFELLLGVLFVTNRGVAAAMSAGFHCALYLLMGSTLGMFFYAGIAAALTVAPRWVLWAPDAHPTRFVRTPAGLMLLCALSCTPWMGAPLLLFILVVAAVAAIPTESGTGSTAG